MIAMQEDEMGGQIEFTSAELANIIATGFESQYFFICRYCKKLPTVAINSLTEPLGDA